jgi:hypothetical protein
MGHLRKFSSLGGSVAVLGNASPSTHYFPSGLAIRFSAARLLSFSVVKGGAGLAVKKSAEGSGQPFSGEAGRGIVL